MKKAALIIIIVFINIYTFSQNLVKNPGFEELKAPYTSLWECQRYFSKYVSNWSSPALFSAEILKYDSTFLLSINDTLVFNNLARPLSGCYMAAIHTYGNSNIDEPYRSYIQGELIEPMIKGKKYTMEFLVAVFSDFGGGTISNNIGVHFSVKKLPNQKVSLIKYKPQINYSELPPITKDKDKEWFRLSWTFIAQDTFKFFTIGNFFSNGATKFKRFTKNSVDWVDYLIDDVKIEEVKDNDSVQEKYLLNKMELNKPITLNNIYFETGKSELLELSFVELNTLFNILKSNPNMIIQISGYTDNIGNEQYNLVLSEKRANAVKEYLSGRGIDKNRIIAKGYGSSSPKVSNDTEEGRAQNRRVEFTVLKNK